MLRGETDWLSEDGSAAAQCGLTLDGAHLPEVTGPGQTDATHANSDFAVRMGHTAVSSVTAPVAAGAHRVAFTCHDTLGARRQSGPRLGGMERRADGGAGRLSLSQQADDLEDEAHYSPVSGSCPG